MRKIDTSNLLRYQTGKYKGKIDWSNNIGAKLLFAYNDQKGEIEVVDYVKGIPQGRITVKYKDNIQQMNTNNLVNCSISNLIGRYNFDYIYNINDVLTTKHGCNLIILNQIKIMHTNCPERGYTVKCLDCGHIYDIREVYIASCPICSDRLSYPEKFVFNMLKQLQINFETEKMFDWSGLKRYDVYIYNQNMIIEINGLQHYSSARQMKIDIQKFNNAFINNIKLYIVIDARESNMKYIKQSILDSELSSFYDLSKIDWLQCHEFACKSRVKAISEMWNNNKSVDDIVKEFDLCKSIIQEELRNGNELGYCIYDKHINLSKSNKENNKKLSKPVRCINTGEIFESQLVAAEAYNIYKSGISDCCSGRIQSAGKHPITGESLKWEKYIPNEK